MKVSEAHTKWCPFVNSRAVTFMANKKGDYGSVTATLDPAIVTPSLNCLGPCCMAWVVFRADVEDPEGYCGLVHSKSYLQCP